MTEGSALHTIDFVNYAVSPGTVFWVRPGQVQQWGRIQDFEATVVLFTPSSLDAVSQQLLDGNARSRQAAWQSVRREPRDHQHGYETPEPELRLPGYFRAGRSRGHSAAHADSNSVEN